MSKMEQRLEMKIDTAKSELVDLRAEMVRELLHLAAKATRHAEELSASPDSNPSHYVGLNDELKSLLARHESTRDRYRLLLWIGKEPS